MANRLDIVELGQAGFRDDLERLARGIRQKVKMKAIHARQPPEEAGTRCIGRAERISLWKTMGKSLAEGSGRFQEKDSSPYFGIDPQFDEE